LSRNKRERDVVRSLDSTDVPNDRSCAPLTTSRRQCSGWRRQRLLDILDGQIEEAGLVGIDLRRNCLRSPPIAVHLGDAGNRQDRWPAA
jgi:hypothetical protein